MNTRILFIDDEIDCLDQLKASLHPKAEQWRLEYSNHPQQALESIRTNPPSIVVCDYRMPQMSGAAFLKIVESEFPSVERFILAAIDEKESLEAEIGSSFHFLPKPCPPEQLINELQRSIAIDTWLGNDRIKQLVGSREEFQSLPPLYLKVVNALNSSNACAEKVGQAIANDLAISAKLLQIVNSSFFGYEEKISDIVQAVGILGLDAVKNLVLAIQVFGKADKSPELKAIADQIWHHSMSVASAAKRIMRYETSDDREAEEAYTAGLFHDIGKLILMSAAPEDYIKARELAAAEKIPQWQAEIQVLGCNHAEVGAYILGRWGMPINIVESTALHHEPINALGSTFSPLAAVHAANALVWERHPGEEPHPSAQADTRFLSEIGQSDSWEAWREVVSGKRTEKPKAPKGGGAAAGAEAARSNAERPSSSNSASPSANRTLPKFAFALIGLAAAAAVAIFLIPSPATNDRSASADLPPDSSRGKTPESDGIEPSSIQPSLLGESIPIPGWNSEPSPVEPEIAALEKPPEDAADVPHPFPSIRLTGIFFNPGSPVASLNGKIRRVGDSVSGAQILSIETKSVTVEFNGESRVLRLQ